MKTMKTRLLTLAVAGVSMLTLSACGGGPEAGSLSHDDPIELAKIHADAVDNEDWTTYCAYLREDRAMYVATYWTRSDDTCADNLESVTWNSDSFSSSYLKAQGGDRDWDTARLVEGQYLNGDPSFNVLYEFTPAGGGEVEEMSVHVIQRDDGGWQY